MGKRKVYFSQGLTEQDLKDLESAGISPDILKEISGLSGSEAASRIQNVIEDLVKSDKFDKRCRAFSVLIDLQGACQDHPESIYCYAEDPNEDATPVNPVPIAQRYGILPVDKNVKR